MILQKNPIPMQGRIEKCWLFTYRTPQDDVATLIPPQFDLVTLGGFAFWNVVVCEIAGMRPLHVPETLGIRYRHVAYRLHVRFREREGLYFLRSDCDCGLLSMVGNLVSDFNFHTAPIRIDDDVEQTRIYVGSNEACAEAVLDRNKRPELGWGSPFESTAHAAEFLKYKPRGIAPNGRTGANIVEISRDEDAWISRLVGVQFAYWRFLDGRNLEPEVCYEVEPIDYRWNRGQVHA